MTPVSHHPPIASTPEGATPVDYEQLRDELADAMMHALNTDHWDAYRRSETAWFFAVAYQPYVLHVDC